MDHYQPPGLIPGVFLAVLLITGCGDEPQAPESASPVEIQAATDDTITLDEWHVQYRVEADQSMAALAAATRNFLKAPEPDRLRQWRDAWVSAHDAYLAMRFVVTGDEPDLADAWPVLPGFIDALPAYPDSGIVNDETLQIDRDTIMAQHQITDDSEVALGFHVIEYYAFSGPFDDFLPDAKNVERRRQFIAIVIDELEDNVRLQISATRQIVPQLDHAALLRILARRSADIALEYAEPDGHSEFSGRSRDDILLRLRLMQVLLSDRFPLSYYLIELDAAKAVAVGRTIAALIDLLGPESGEDRKQVTLLLAGLTHQLQDLAHLASATER